MNFVNPNAELWNQPDSNNGWKEHVVRCAKVCYRSEKDVDIDTFLEARLKAGHYSILRHATAYFKIPLDNIILITFIKPYLNSPGISYCYGSDNLFISMNYQFMQKNLKMYNDLYVYQIDILEASNIREIMENIFRYTFYLQTQISTSRELNRVSPNNILEESTRYVDQGTICRPWWWDLDIYGENIKNAYKVAQNDTFFMYNTLLRYGMAKEDARGILSLDTCTHVVYTYTIKEWRDIIDKRYYGTTGKPHPNCVEIMEQVVNLLKEEGHEFRDR